MRKSLQEIFTRFEKNPILLPLRNQVWESRKVYNAGAVYHDGKFHLFYRAVGGTKVWHSSIGHAVSRDGEKFRRVSDTPVLGPGKGFEKRGVEDPRVTKVGDTFYMTYTGYDGLSARLCLAVSKDLRHWKRCGLMIPQWDFQKASGFVVKWDVAQHNPVARKAWIKAGGIFPKRINGRFWMMFGDRHLWLAHSGDGLHWEPVWKPFVQPRKGFFDSVHVEMGPPPMLTQRGWLVLYHGVDDKKVYRLGFLLLDRDDPMRILYRSSRPIFEPSFSYELSGLVDLGGLPAPRVIFACGAVVRKSRLRLYYGAGDFCVAGASASLNTILNTINI